MTLIVFWKNQKAVLLWAFLFNKNNPKEFWIAEDGANKGREYILIIIGAIFLGISIIRKIFGFIF